jgi:hypothetical protein
MRRREGKEDIRQQRCAKHDMPHGKNQSHGPSFLSFTAPPNPERNVTLTVFALVLVELRQRFFKIETFVVLVVELV